MRAALAIAAFAFAVSGVCQDQPPPAAAPPAPPAPVLIPNTGKPMRAPFECSEEQVQSAGLACSEEEPCPIFLEIAAVAAVGPRLFAAGNFHSSSATVASALLVSDDGGNNWHEGIEPIRGAALEHIQFIDPLTGWISGQVVSPLPQDPFLLVTTDGGKTWRKRQVFSESAESRLGVIQQFLFTARDAGSLIVDRGQGSDTDRYELYESPDAGESWGIKESSSKPIKLRRAPVPNADWRIRVDARSQSFHIEKRSGETWDSIAAFQVNAGACKQK